MTSKNEGMASKSIEEASGTTDDTTTTDNSTTTDTTAPTVSSTYPSNSASSVAPNTTITVTFSEAMEITTITTNTSNTTCSGSLQVSSDSFNTCLQMSSASPSVSNSNKTFTLDPASNLSYNTTYKVKVTTDAKDTAGNALTSSYTHSAGFTTSSTPDTTAPTVSSISPTDSQSEVSTTENISVTFSEAMDTTSVTTNTSNTSCSGSFQLSSDNFSSCVQMSSSPTTSNSNKTFTVDPSSDLSLSSTYKIIVTTGVKDSAGNNLTSQYGPTNGFATCSENVGFAIGGRSGLIFTSTNGTACWINRTSGTSQHLDGGVSYLNNLFIALGQFGTILTSSDGVTWTARTSGTTSNLWAAAHGNSTYVVVGDSAHKLLVVPEVLAVHVTPSEEVRIVPNCPKAINRLFRYETPPSRCCDVPEVLFIQQAVPFVEVNISPLLPPIAKPTFSEHVAKPFVGPY
jgi:hypothetical protein